MRRKFLLLLCGSTIFYITLVSTYLMYLNTEYPLYNKNEIIAKWSTYILLFSVVCFVSFIIYVKNTKFIFISITMALILALLTPTILMFFYQIPEYIHNIKKYNYEKEIHSIEKVVVNNQQQLDQLHLYKDESIRLSKELDQISIMFMKYENEITKSEVIVLLEVLPYSDIRIILSDQVGDIKITTDKQNNISKCEPLERCTSLNLFTSQ